MPAPLNWNPTGTCSAACSTSSRTTSSQLSPGKELIRYTFIVLNICPETAQHTRLLLISICCMPKIPMSLCNHQAVGETIIIVVWPILIYFFAVTSTTVSGQSSSSGRTRTVGDSHLDPHLASYLDPHVGSYLNPHVGSHVDSSRAPYVLLGVK